MPGTNYRGVNLRDWQLQGAPTTTLQESFSRSDCNADGAALTSAVMTAVAIMLQAGSTPPSLLSQNLGNAVINAVLAGQSVLVGSGGSGLTAAAPATLPTLTPGAVRPYVVAS